MTPQEIFDKCAVHLFAQGERSGYSSGGNPAEDFVCLYRGPEGRKCAVGIFISDELYSRGMEGATISCLLEQETCQLPTYMTEHPDLLGSLQFAHDNDMSWQSSVAMRQALRSVATAYALDDKVVDGLRFAWDMADAVPEKEEV